MLSRIIVISRGGFTPAGGTGDEVAAGSVSRRAPRHRQPQIFPLGARDRWYITLTGSGYRKSLYIALHRNHRKHRFRYRSGELHVAQ